MHAQQLLLPLTLLAARSVLAAPPPPPPPPPPTCTDGGTLHCCQATFAGDLPLVVSVANITGYELTPADLNCLGTNAPIQPKTGCVGTYACCQVNDFAPIVGLFCSKPPGDCVGGKANCTNLANGFNGGYGSSSG